uniref:C-type lectin domain family 4 member D n=1 Tax=Apteryx owenii TaxID=8824 RepID=A0A8B9PGC3_APTOW
MLKACRLNVGSILQENWPAGYAQHLLHVGCVGEVHAYCLSSLCRLSVVSPGCRGLTGHRLRQGWMCCPMGWRFFQKSCYYTSTDSMSWNESKENCTGMGSHLVVIDTEAEQVSAGKDNYYIGLSAQKVGQWHWVDQTPFNVTAVFWRTGEPSNVEEEKCVVIHWKEKKHWNWNDFRCEVHSPRICEAAAITV